MTVLRPQGRRTPSPIGGISQRIERANCLLTTFSLSVTEIGQRLGFSESSAFAATFRKIAGWSPSDFRRTLE